MSTHTDKIREALAKARQLMHQAMGVARNGTTILAAEAKVDEALAALAELSKDKAPPAAPLSSRARKAGEAMRKRLIAYGAKQRESEAFADQEAADTTLICVNEWDAALSEEDRTNTETT